MSAEIIPDPLDLFSEPDALLSVSDSHFEKIRCKTALPTNELPSTIEFTANADKSHYTDLANSLLVLRVRYLKDDGSNLNAIPQMAPVQNLAGSMFKGTDIWMNNVKITPPENNLHYISFFNKFLYPSTAEPQMTLSGWYPDDYSTLAKARQDDPNERGVDKNSGLQKRCLLIGESRPVNLITKLYAAPHLIQRWFPPGCKFDWSFQTEDYKFFTISPATATQKGLCIIVGAEIWLKRLNVSPSVAIAHKKLLEEKNMIFPCKYMESRTMDIAAGSDSFKFDNVFQGGKMPTALFAMMVRGGAKKGNLQQNPFVFEHADLSELRCYLGSKVFPSTMYKINPSKWDTEPAILDTLLALDAYGSHQGPAQLSRDTFVGGCCILGLDLSRDSNPTASYINTDFDSTALTLEGSFDSPATTNYVLLVLAVFNGRLELNKFLVPTTTWT